MVGIPRDLTENVRKDGINLFLGAGVSVSSGLPTWNELTETMIKRAYPSTNPYVVLDQVAASVLNSVGPVEAMRIVRQKLGDSFLNKLTDALYKSHENNLGVIDAIADFKHVRFVCSYNFDDLLEQLLTEKRRYF